MLDNLFFEFSQWLHLFPSILISFISILICAFAVVFSKRYFGYAGLCCYMLLSTIIGNIQVLYATHYEIINMPVLLGTVALSSSFLCCDFINEYYGSDNAKKAIYLSFIIQIFFLLNIILTLGHKPLEYAGTNDFSTSKETLETNMKSIAQIFLPIPRLFIASYIAYLVSQLSEVWAYNSINKLSFIKSAYLKNNISLFFSSVILDTMLFTVIALVLLADEPLSNSDFWKICFSACSIRICCNFINSMFLKFEIKKQLLRK